MYKDMQSVEFHVRLPEPLLAILGDCQLVGHSKCTGSPCINVALVLQLYLI
jgi:hypothetical protein